jgi:hypothetical protein
MQNVRTIPQTVVVTLPPQKYAHIFDITRYAFVVIWLSSNSQVQFFFAPVLEYQLENFKFL